MKNTTPPVRCSHLLLLVLMFSLSSCFPLAVRFFKQGNRQKAKPLFEKSLGHRVYDPGARFYLARMEVNRNPNTLAWLEISTTFCELEQEVGRLPEKQALRLSRHDVTRGEIINAREKLQRRITGRMAESGTIPELQALEAASECWPTGSVDTLRAIVVNKNIDSEQPVYDTESEKDWKGVPVTLPTEEQVRSEPGRSCAALGTDEPPGISYEDATTIALHYADAVLPVNYPRFWEIRKNIWRTFRIHHSYCEMDRFKAEHPENTLTEDCWYDNARDTLCLGLLRPLLAFHRNNPFTALDPDICFQVMCLALYAEDANELNAEERRQLKDVEMMFNLQRQLLRCEQIYDSTELVSNVAYLARTYPHHRMVFDLATKVANHFAHNGRLALARDALDTFRPLFPDTSVCASDYFFQIRKQAWFGNFEALLDRAGDKMILPQPASAWNTADNDEYAMVSWGETDEVFFMRRNRANGTVRLMTSRLKNRNWTKPAPVEELSVSDDVVPLSISSSGRLMLLRSEGKLLHALRPDINRPWSSPEPLPMPGRFAGNAWIAPDDSLMLIEYYVTPSTALAEPAKNLAVSQLDSAGAYGQYDPLGGVNLADASEGNPCMALGGRLLLFTSDRIDGLGYKDLYSVSLTKPRDWKTMGEPLNMGLQLNTIFEDEGISYFSEYTGMAYFHRLDRCTEDMDIWKLKLKAEVFPENAMRLAGLVLDENGKPIGGGFMEFTPDYQLNVHSQPISPKGTYSYTVADSTVVVRLFPEIPGYYSERDTTHFLANVARGEIIRDTFVLTSFDYIRKHYRLVHSTFHNGTAEFDNPGKAYPELTRLAKIATRMGAELRLSGHTDGSGLESGNQELSLHRARSVKQFLVEKCGFNPDKIYVYGYGESRPICPNDTEEGRRCNRRVEVVFRMPVLPGGE